MLGYDEITATVIIRKRPPWDDEGEDAPWNDYHVSLTRVWFEREAIAVSLGDIGRSAQVAARAQPFHPARIDTWIVKYFNADDTPYVLAIGPRFLISGSIGAARYSFICSSSKSPRESANPKHCEPWPSRIVANVSPGRAKHIAAAIKTALETPAG